MEDDLRGRLAALAKSEGGKVKAEEPNDLIDRTYQFARRIVRLYAALPRNGLARALGDQVLRSGTSIGANYREARRGRSRAEFIAKCGDCLREADETAYWLALLADEKVVPPKRLAPLRKEADELIAIFVSIINSAKGGE